MAVRSFAAIICIRTLKENLLWVKTFASVDELRQALLVFMETYNGSWPIGRHGFRPPAAIRREQLPSVAEVALGQAWWERGWGRYILGLGDLHAQGTRNNDTLC
jgi:hypothetical protein